MKVLSFYLVIMLSLNAHGEEDAVSRLLEHISFLHEESINYEQITEQLQDLLDNPINLRTATPDQLKALHILSTVQINAIVNYCSNDQIISVYELQTLQEIDLITLKLILPFLKLSLGKTQKKGFELKHSQYLIFRYDKSLNTKSGFIRKDSVQPFSGGPGRLLLRYRLNYPGKLSIGLNMEKDAGESLIWDPKRALFIADYVNFHLMYSGKSLLKQFIIGDYRIQFGQGLIMGGAGFNLGKGSDVILGTKRNDIGIKPHSSVSEFGFFRGLASTIVYKTFKASIFLSHQKKDAGPFIENGTTLYSLRNTGLHRTINEIEGRRQLKETTIGINLNYQWKNIYDMGINYMNTTFSKPVGKSTTIYNHDSFRGKNQSNMSMYVDVVFKNINFFSELALDLNTQSIAWVMGSLWSISKRFELSLHWRNYPKTFNSLFGNAFSEKSGQQNETGIYMGIQCKISKRNQWTIYVDQFHFPWLRFQQSRPSSGSELGLSWQLKTSNHSNIALRYRQKILPQDKTNTTYLNQTVESFQQQLRISISKESKDWLSMKWHLQASRIRINPGSEKGILIAQDIIVNPWKKIRLMTRFSFFDTFSFNSRQYIYENELLYGFSIPSFSGTGLRYYLLTKFTISRKLNFWVKYGLTHYIDRNFIGSGNDRINGNKKEDLKFQLLYKL